MIVNRIYPNFPARGTGLAAGNVPHTIGAPVAQPARPAPRGGPVQRGLGTTRATGIATTATAAGRQ
jgi:hypothetical protein